MGGWRRSAFSGSAVRIVLRIPAWWGGDGLRGRQTLMCTLESCRPRLVAAAGLAGLVGNGGSCALRSGPRRRRGVGSGSGQRSLATCGLGGRESGLVSQGAGTGGGGLAAPSAPICGEEIRICGCGRASVGTRALRFLCRRARIWGQSAGCPAQLRGHVRWKQVAAGARGRCDYARPHAACRGAQAA
jgi:hypothetical protein